MTDPIRYADIGLVNTKEMFQKAMQGKFAVPAYNFNNMEQLQAIITGCVQSDSPVIREFCHDALYGGRCGGHGAEHGQ